MKKLPCAVAVMVSCVMMVSCSHAPQLHEDSKTLQKSRIEYVQNHPDGQYNDNILNGEIAKGMGASEVEVSWGFPDKRRDVDEGKFEQWIYAVIDDVSERLVVYSLTFTNQTLVHWEIHENLVTGQGIRPDLDNVPVVTPSDLDRVDRDAAPIKK